MQKDYVRLSSRVIEQPAMQDATRNMQAETHDTSDWACNINNQHDARESKLAEESFKICSL